MANGFLVTKNKEMNVRPLPFVNTQRTLLKETPHGTYVRNSNGNASSFQEKDTNRMTMDDSASLVPFREMRKLGASTIYIETVVVTDKTMLIKYGRQNLPPYILSAMQEAAGLFRSETISTDVRLVLSYFLILESDRESGLEITKDSKRTLKNFCRWKTTLTPSLPSHDIALLFTRNDLCIRSSATCATYGGLAFTSGVCREHSKCAILRDDGTHLAAAVAHEIGHTLGLMHDEDIGCDSPENKRVMGSHLSGFSPAIGWSSCSNKSLLEFLRWNDAECLYNVPVTLNQLQIASHSRNKLCQELLLDATATSCEHVNANSSCAGVWCTSSSTSVCTLFTTSRSDKFPCGNQKFCVNGQCLPGTWTEWSEYGPCSTTCSQGIRNQEGCYGNRTQYQICNLRPCPLGSDDAKETACASFNDKPHFDGKYYNWVFYLSQGNHKNNCNGITDVSQKCKLTCKPDSNNFFAVLSPFVPDGTACTTTYQQAGVCIKGKCLSVGCGGVVQWNATRHSCDVCGANDTSCRIVASVFKRRNLGFGYHKIFLLPLGVVNVYVKELAGHDNYLAIKSGRNNRFYINGELKISQPGRFSHAGTIIQYSRIPGVSENIHIKGPTTEALVIMVIIQAPVCEVFYQYQVYESLLDAHGVKASAPYRWRYTTWSNCSHACGGGAQTRRLVCFDTNTSTDVEKTLCTQSINRTDLSRPCNFQPCTTTMWSVGSWSPCSRSCGTEGVRKRKVSCVMHINPKFMRKMERSRCDQKKRPHGVQTCNRHSCPVGVWFEERWQSCSVTCGWGWQTRSTTCRKKTNGSLLPKRYCDRESRPINFKICSLSECVSDVSRKQPGCVDLEDCRLFTIRLCEKASRRRKCCYTCQQLALEQTFSSVVDTVVAQK
ncbi:A disintegrin and metalloproteinase with thrombospondin motifs 12-like [Corticium candelabrum]|uniref:A disintegrin and metalloproteinase with thrombospondin motifs 12-like n=1 Tax=Corticium candelabrum TaxID=121492 RepID=UPI002E2528B1|nr:A disintegrin and metalloproteinase with thrombospondin motifs 12-like [Corticium candelabrum]